MTVLNIQPFRIRYYLPITISVIKYKFKNFYSIFTVDGTDLMFPKSQMIKRNDGYWIAEWIIRNNAPEVEYEYLDVQLFEADEIK